MDDGKQILYDVKTKVKIQFDFNYFKEKQLGENKYAKVYAARY